MRTIQIIRPAWVIILALIGSLLPQHLLAKTIVNESFSCPDPAPGTRPRPTETEGACDPTSLLFGSYVRNGDFRNSMEYWSLVNDGAVTRFGVIPGSSITSSQAHMIVSGAGDDTVTFRPRLYAAINIVNNQSYTLRYRAYANVSRPVQPGIWSPTWSFTCPAQVITTTQREYACLFTPVGAIPTSTIVYFGLGGTGMNGTEVYLDDIKILDSAQSIIFSENFESGLSGWGLGDANGTTLDQVGTVARTGVVTVTRVADQVMWRPRLTTLVSVNNNHTYELKFKARSNRAKTILAAFWSPTWSQDCGLFALTTTAKEFSCMVTPTAADPNDTSLYFGLGGAKAAGTTVYFDWVTLKAVN